jgi:regulator of cell morphogenesis and NO signaling
MTADKPSSATELIAQVMARFHDVHREELPAIVALARSLDAQGVSPPLAEALQAMAQALELHMFKEEMRLFPMMEQGGNTLIVPVMDDLHAEHRSHRDAMAQLDALLADALAPAGHEADLAALRQAVAKLLDDVAQHIEVEDGQLFPLFGWPRR